MRDLRSELWKLRVAMRRVEDASVVKEDADASLTYRWCSGLRTAGNAVPMAAGIRR